MAVRDQITKMDIYKADYSVISTDTTTAGPIFDTSGHELGFSAFIEAVAWTDGTYTMLIQEGDDSALSDAVTLPTAKLIGSLPAVSALTADGAICGSVGIHSNLRYVRVSVVSTSTDTGATIATGVIKHGENLPL